MVRFGNLLLQFLFVTFLMITNGFVGYMIYFELFLYKEKTWEQLFIKCGWPMFIVIKETAVM